MKKRIIILGANGFIGRAVSILFLQKKAKVELFSKHKGKINGHVIEQLDISKKRALWYRLGNKGDIGTMIYLSAKTPGHLASSPWSTLSYNINLHKQVIECWQKFNCHLIYASASDCSMYGHSGLLPWREKNFIILDDYYSISKFVGELLFQQKAQEKNLPLTILRLNAPYGCNTSRKTVINIFIERALKGKDLVLWGSGKRAQDFIYIDDAARVFWLSYKNKKYGIFNIATGRSVTMKYLARLILNLTGSQSKIIFSGKSDPEEGFRAAIDISKTRQHLGFSTLHSLETGLKKCIAEYKGKLYENRYFSRHTR